MKKHLKNNVHWVGKVDWELRKFHGDDYCICQLNNPLFSN